MKKYFFAGLITLLPIAVTFMIVRWLFNFFTTPLAGIVEYFIIAYEEAHNSQLLHHDTLVFFISRITVLLFLVIFIFLLGILGRNVLSGLINRFFSRIPLIKGIYRVSRDVTKAIFSKDEKTFKQTVLVPFPNGDTHAIGFLTGEVPPGLRKFASDAEVSVFVPTSPHPISGFMLLTPKKLALPIDVTIEEGFKFLLSCGTFHPGEKTPP